MLHHILMLAALAAACAGCSAPPVHIGLAEDNPANPDAASVPFVRPLNVLAEAPVPQTTRQPPMMHMAGGSMAGMDVPGGAPNVGQASLTTMTHKSAGETATAAQAPTASPSAGQIEVIGVVRAVDTAARSVTIEHQAIKAFGEPAGTMELAAALSIKLGAIRPGDRIAVALSATDAEGKRRILQLTPVPQ